MGESEHLTRILYANYRSSPAVTDNANRILKIKNARLGSVDKESHYLIQSRSQHQGHIIFLRASEANVRELNQKTKKSTKVAVIVLRDEWKSAAARLFDTPLIFSIYEAKGLEYDTIILFDGVSAESQPFLEITRGVTAEDLSKELSYARLKDKSDRSLEVYKFYINALYVAVTRAIQNIYWVESNVQHPLFSLLALKESQDALHLTDNTSTLEEWQREARKLELQGKQEQADAIRERFIQKKPVPWEVITFEKAVHMSQTLFEPGADKKSQISFFEYALVYQHQDILDLFIQKNFPPAKNLQKSADLIQRKYFDSAAFKNPAGMLREVALYGVDFRNPFNQTPLMVAAYVGNAALVKILLETGANPDLTQNRHYTAFQILLAHACQDSRFCRTKLAENYLPLAPSALSLQANHCLIKIDQKNMEFLMFYLTIPLLIQNSLVNKKQEMKALSAAEYLNIIAHFPESVLPEYRKQRSYLSNILSKNEITREGRYNRKLFKRVRHGHYILNPGLSVKIADEWMPIAEALCPTTVKMKTVPQHQPEWVGV